MVLPITALYGGLLTLVLLWLSFGAGAMRGKTGISIGDGGNVALLEKIRRHGNAVEYVPMAIILIGILEANGANSWFLHGLGLVLLLSRIAHPLGLKADNMGHPLRAVGSGGTALMMVVGAGYAIWQYVTAMTA